KAVGNKALAPVPAPPRFQATAGWRKSAPVPDPTIVPELLIPAAKVPAKKPVAAPPAAAASEKNSVRKGSAKKTLSWMWPILVFQRMIRASDTCSTLMIRRTASEFRKLSVL